MLDPPPEEPAKQHHDDALDAVAAAVTGADQETIDDWQTETDSWVVAELTAAEAGCAAGNTISGEELRRRFALP